MARREDSELGAGLQAIAAALRLLGNADAATSMGGLEALGAAIKDGSITIAGGLDGVAEALLDVATAIKQRGIVEKT